MRGLTGVVTGNAVQLYGITAVSTGTGANHLVTLSDTLDGTSAPSFSTLATAPLNCVFRGVALAPVPEPSSVVLGLFGVGMLAAVARRRGRKNATG
jgi:MYXO-CTERM domain-containing protein